jgi:hypothetical protein
MSIKIHIDPPLISCTPKGGNAHKRHGEGLQWDSDDAPFTLTFHDLDSGQPIWPFEEEQPKWPVMHTGVLTLQNGGRAALYAKYTVAANNCPPLDPIIIIDNR